MFSKETCHETQEVGEERRGAEQVTSSVGLLQWGALGRADKIEVLA